jgi:hypothetical protein
LAIMELSIWQQCIEMKRQACARQCNTVRTAQ